MRKLLFALGVVTATGAVALGAAAARAQCPGTSGSATINAAAWTAQCVIAASAADCVDSLGNNYTCFEVVGSNGTDPSYSTVALFFSAPPTQGQTYELGGASGNGAMVVGEAAFCITADPPYTGQVTVNIFNSGTGAFDCTFHFQARSIFFGPDLDVTGGHFIGNVVAVAPATWSDVKAIYR
jgi:hypothetical protein